MNGTYAFSLLNQTFSFKEVSDDLTEMDFSKIFAMIRLSDRMTLLSSVTDDTNADAVKWKCLKLEGEYDFTAYGILSEISHAFAKACVPVMAFSDYRTDYFAVQHLHLAAAIEALEAQGNTVCLESLKEINL